MFKIILFVSFVNILNACTHTQSEKIDNIYQQIIPLIDAFELIADEKIPPALLKHSEAILIAEITKSGLLLGLETGNGILTIRKQQKWSNPILINMRNMSLGLQAGIEVQKLVVIFTDRNEAIQFAKGNSKMCFGFNVTIGPLTNEISTNTIFDKNVYAYTTGMGIFGGMSFKTASLTVDNAANRSLYGKIVSFDDIVNGNAKKSAIIISLQNTLKERTSE
ncbi:lipid-binding SYLF domain-containing protein [Candidatus Marithrix sp. Canyon 246]|uniref:lipid-binding SYLF domain-containing protein n=1 Tax=Candidatus Marithrix sp. Canyon 246 TaxID=1827136 RepID=UPI000849FAAA|nr:lipid-binding SYLF domain-containing protein [Candidatus Marithrix sp. Canyon 246]